MTNADTPSLLFELLSLADIDTVVDIERRSFEHPWSRNMFLREVEASPPTVTVARLADSTNRLIAYLCRWVVVDEVQILNLAVDPDWRRRGVAQALMKRLLAEARDRHVRTVTLEVRDGNEAAVKLYESLGFERNGVRRNYYGPGRDGVLMSLTMQSEQA